MIEFAIYWIRMQLLMLICILGLNIYQATGDNSTQMLYFTLEIDSNVENIVTKNLTSFANTTWNVDKPVETTSCKNSTTVKMCTCMPGYRWSDEVCRNQTCCGSSSCNFSLAHSNMCIANTTVTIAGSLTLKGDDYQMCLAAKGETNYITCNGWVTNNITNIYSTLKSFDVLKIQQYRVGSVIADFQIIIFSDISVKALINKSVELAQKMRASMILTTTGVLQMHILYDTASYLGNQTITCTSQEDLGSNLTWQIQNQNAVNLIYNGSEATVTVTDKPSSTTLRLTRTTELWEGTYTCAYVNTADNITITHAAIGVMDVALLPQIQISTDPQFPQCSSSDGLQKVIVTCQIAKTTETYNVIWSRTGITAQIIERPDNPKIPGKSADVVVSCNSGIPTVTCTFTNKLNQSASVKTNINIITAGENYCKSDGYWPNTKVNFTAVLPCSGSAGQQLRTCNGSDSNPRFDDLISQCVTQKLFDVLQKSMIVDIGLGLKDQNGALVFSQLQGVTNTSNDIDSFPNMNASIYVLIILNSKLATINNVTAVNDFLTSSSNLLNISSNSWNNSNQINPNNLTLAEYYLENVEMLIKKSNLSKNSKTNVQVDTCVNTPTCQKTVFGNSINLTTGSSVTVKTAGFNNLQIYLPSHKDSQPNSMVVSATTENNNRASFSPKIIIDFQLINKRPRNVKLMCVAWDNNSRSWSEDGCVWQGVQNEGRCVCDHLSSFAILMSKTPIKILWADEITYAGLGVSILSLILGIMIEITVWGTVVKTNTLYLRHTAHFHISLCLLIADTCFLASSIGTIPDIWCLIFVVLKHFCYLAMFFWMLCLSTTLLHQAVYLFHNVSKKGYLRFSLVLGYVCPFLIVFITFMINDTGAKDKYYTSEGCWLVYIGGLEGSIFTFIIPIGVIIFVNVFSMLVVIMKLLDHPKSTDKSHDKDKNAAKTVVRTVILLTPIFGVTWSLGFAIMILDLTSGTIVYVVNYAFILLNAFQGFFILLTTCIGDKNVRETLFSRFRKKAQVSISNSTTKTESSCVK